MNTLVYYLSLPFIYLVALLPFWWLRRVSDFLFVVLYYLLAYRKKVVLSNLRNAFPEKSEADIQQIARQHYRYLCDLILETLKTLTISPAAVKKHVQFEGIALLEKYYQEGRSVILILGHFGNWELAGARFGIEPIHQLYVIYRPLKNKHFDQLLYHMRTRLGNGLYAMKETLRGMVRDRKVISATAFIADQTPSPDKAHWLTFLHQDTPIFMGTEKIAAKFNYPVIYVSVKRLKRSYYRIESELLFDQPKDTAEYEISQAYTRRLEQDIQAQPEIWLWTHRRWKHKRQQPQHGK